MAKRIHIAIQSTFYLLLFGFFGLLTSLRVKQISYEGLTIIANANTNISQLKNREFTKIILGENQTWPGGKAVYVALMKPNTPTGLLIIKEIFDMNANEFNKYWLGLVFEGKCKAPVSFSSDDDLVNYVSITPGAIGVVSSGTNISKVIKLNIVK